MTEYTIAYTYGSKPEIEFDVSVIADNVDAAAKLAKVITDRSAKGFGESAKSIAAAKVSEVYINGEFYTLSEARTWDASQKSGVPVFAELNSALAADEVTG